MKKSSRTNCAPRYFLFQKWYLGSRHSRMLFLESLNRNPVIYNLDDRVLNSHESRENILFWYKNSTQYSEYKKYILFYELMPTLNFFQPFLGWFILILDVNDGNFGIFLSISRERISPNDTNSFVFASFLDLFSSDSCLFFLFWSPLFLSASTGKNLFLYLSTIGIESCGNKRAKRGFQIHANPIALIYISAERVYRSKHQLETVPRTGTRSELFGSIS